jgi:thiamine pyrophosphokinase
MKTVILTGGTPPEKHDLEAFLAVADMLIGVDGAACTFIAYGITPNVLIGDFDTASVEHVHMLEERGVKIIRLTPEKNETDTEAALEYAIADGADEITILGAMGNRFDHSLANVYLLILADRAGVRCRIIDGDTELTVSNKDTDVYGRAGQTLSLMPLTGDVCVNATNLKYPLDDLNLRQSHTRGISNVRRICKLAAAMF